MGAGRAARGAAGVVALAVALSGCGGGKSDAEKAKAGAEAAVSQLAKGEGGASSCRALTPATRRAIARLADGSGGCTANLNEFENTFGLNPGLVRAKSFAATVDGNRATVVAQGVTPKLSAVRTGADWRVSLIGVPGVRGDLAAASACSSYVKAADTVVLPALSAAGVAAQLTHQAALLATLRRRLRSLPHGGPTRALGALSLTLAGRRQVLLHEAAKLRAGGDLHVGQGTGALVYRELAEEVGSDPSARVHCPKAAIDSAGARVIQGREIQACPSVRRTLARLNGEHPSSLAELRANLAERERFFRTVVARIVSARGLTGSLELPATLARARMGAASANAQLIAIFGQLQQTTDEGTFDSLAARGAPLAGRVDGILTRFGGTCVTGGGGSGGGLGTAPTQEV